MTTLGEIWRARAVIAGRVHRTPLVRSSALGRQVGVQLFLKAECLQKTGSFKVRGVFTKLAALWEQKKQRGLITISAGNHGQAVAYAAAAEGVRCIVVMPEYASPAKIDACRQVRELHEELRALPEGERAVLELVSVDGLTVAEAAAALGIRAATARVRLHRARRALRSSPRLATATEVRIS